MKRWLYLLGALAVLGVVARLPHPARDIAKLDPVQTVYLYVEAGQLHIETDTGDHGSGPTLTAAAADLRARADAEIFLDTAEYLLLDPGVAITDEFYTLLRPACRVVFTQSRPDLEAAAGYLAIHTPETTLARLRAQNEIPQPKLPMS